MDLPKSAKTADAIMVAIKMTGIYLPMCGAAVAFLAWCFDPPFSTALIAIVKDHTFTLVCLSIIFYFNLTTLRSVSTLVRSPNLSLHKIMQNARSGRCRSAWRRSRTCTQGLRPAADPSSFVDLLQQLKTTSPGLAFPQELAGPLTAVNQAAVLTPNGGLPLLAATLAARSPLRVCYLGGSVTEQKAGWRPRVTTWLGGRASTEEVPAFCGNCGSKVMAFLVADWVVSRAPQLLFVELSINDGDTLLESDDAVSLGCAFEGILRHVRRELPCCEVCVVSMSVRDDLPLEQRTGTKAWSENAEPDAARAYLATVPRLHGSIAAHYGAPHVNLVPLFAALPPARRHLAFRDDCHHTEAGAALAAAAVCHCLRRLCDRPNPDGSTLLPPPPPPLLLPPPLYAAAWACGRTQPVAPRELSFFYVPPTQMAADAPEATQRALQAELLARHTQLDMDPLCPTQRAAWWLLYPGEHAQLRFSGTRLGILTMLGPDAGTVSCVIDGGRGGSCTRCLLDRHSYYWRLAVVLLVEGLPAGEHVATLTLEAEQPDHAAILKRPPTGEHWEACRREAKDHKLWLMHWLVS